MSESRFLTPEAIAGLSLREPRTKYEATGPAFGTACLDRGDAWRPLGFATLTLRSAPTPSAPAGCSVPAIFDLGRFSGALVAGYGTAATASSGWRALLVEQGLLSHPDAVVTGALPAGWDTGLAPERARALAASLSELNTHFVWLTRGDRAAAHHGLGCDACQRTWTAMLTPRRQRKPRLGAKKKKRSPPVTLFPCPHLPAALEALGELARQNPELTFELIGWTRPAPTEATGKAPTRFVLHDTVVSALLGHWLLAKTPAEWKVTRRHPRGSETRGRSYFRGSAPVAREPSNVWLPAAKRNALTLAAAVHGIAAPPEALILIESPAPAVPELDPNARPHLDAIVELPAAPETPPKDGGSTLKRRRLLDP